MRKVIASLLAGATVLSMASMMTFAAKGTAAVVGVDIPGDASFTKTATGEQKVKVTLTIQNPAITLESKEITVADSNKVKQSDVQTAFDGVANNDWTVASTGNKITLTKKATGEALNVQAATANFQVSGTLAEDTEIVGTVSTKTDGTADTCEEIELNNGAALTAVQGKTLKLSAKAFAEQNKQNPMPNEKVTWSLEGAVAGTSLDKTTEIGVDQEVTLTVAANQDISADKLKVKVTPKSNAGKAVTKAIEVTAAQQPGQVVTTVEITNKDLTVAKGSTLQCTAAVKDAQGTEMSAEKVTWEVTGGVAGTKIDANTGLLTVDAAETAQTLTVTATSATDTSKKSTPATITVKDAPTNGSQQTGVVSMVDGDGKAINLDKVAPNSTVYGKLDGIIAGVEAEDLADKDMFKVDIKKATGSKVIKNVSVSEEKIGGTRIPVIKVETKELMDDSDNKVVLEVTIKPKSAAIKKYENRKFKLEDEYKMNDIKFYVSNDTDNGDQDYTAGKGGVVLKPTANEDNEIVWSDENRDLARLTFEADSDAGKIYPKLSTKWDSQYNDVIGNADAFLYDFVGHPSISSTSRATLEIYNPFYNSNEDKFDVAVEDIMIYEEIDGELVDITDRVTAGTNEDGDQVLTLRTRTLGDRKSVV